MKPSEYAIRLLQAAEDDLRGIISYRRDTGTLLTYLLKKEMNPSTGSGRAGYETRNTFHEILKRRLEYGTKSRF